MTALTVMDGNGAAILLNLLVLLVLILVNAFFAATEIAIISLNDSRIRKQAEDGDPVAKRIHKLLAEPGRFLATIQVGITFAGFLASAFAAESFAGVVAALIDPSGELPFVHTATVVVITLVLSYFSLVFGELVPKRLALKSPEKISAATVGAITAVGVVLKPFVKLLTLSSNLTLRMLGVDPVQRERTVTEEEIRMMVDVGQEAGSIHAQEKQLIENIFEFNDKAVSEIMRHRTEIVSLPVDATFEEVLALAVNEKYTRIPVYEDSIDNIVGILHVKDLLYVAMEGLKAPFSLRGMIRPPYLIPESKPIDKLFREMQRDRAQLAVIIDEYGGTAGIVTLEDLIEEIVGSLQDEYDDEEQEMTLCADGTYLIDGKTPLEDVSDAIDLTLPCEDYDTMGGFVMGVLGRVPEEDEKPVADYRNLHLEVVEMDEKRISKVRLTIRPPEPAEGEASEGDDDGGNG
jgi:putative hemolysin